MPIFGLDFSYIMSRIKRFRPCRRQIQGRKVLEHVENHATDAEGLVPVTAARRFVAENGIQAPAIIAVKRNQFTTDHFFWAERGMFGLPYVEHNWVAFPCLHKIADMLEDHELQVDISIRDMALEAEPFLPEFSYI